MTRSVEVTDVWLKRIKEHVTGIEFGTIQITVHDGQIVQIDRTERKRFDTNKLNATSSKRN